MSTNGVSGKRKRIVFVHGEPYTADVVPELRKRGVDIVALTTRGEGSFEAYQRHLDPGTVHMNATDARFGVTPAGVDVKPADPAEVQAMLPSALPIVQMIDRMNVDGRSVAEHHSRFLKILGIWLSIFDAVKPDAVVYGNGLPQFGFDYLVFQLAKRRGLKTVLFRFVNFDDRVMPCTEVEDVPGPSAAEIEAAPPAAPPKSADVAAIDELYKKAMDTAHIRKKLSRAGVARTLVGRRMLGRLKAAQPWFLDDPNPTLLRTRAMHFQGRQLARQCLERYDAMARTPSLDEPYVYFPLPTEPEEGNMPAGGVFADTPYTIATLAAALPPGWRVIVKEHANQFNGKYLMSKGRGLRFYDELSAMRGVECATLETPSREIIKRARAVAVISGTSGWEALQAGVPALVFGKPWYLRAPGVRRIDSGAACRTALADIAANPNARVSQDLVARFANLIQTRYSERLIYSTAFTDSSPIPLAENAARLADVIARMVGAT